jgi:hypothetical protein
LRTPRAHRPRGEEHAASDRADGDRRDRLPRPPRRRHRHARRPTRPGSRHRASRRASRTWRISIRQLTYQYNALGRRDPFQPMVGGEFVGDDVGGDAPSTSAA